MNKEKIIAKYGTDITQLNIANVRKWVRALRSGKYKKTEGTLFMEDEGQSFYCALGVAAHVAGVADELIEGGFTLPQEACEYLGVESSNPDVGHLDVADRNDEGQSFKKIANAIEHYWIKPYMKFKHCFLKQQKGSAK